MRGRIGMHMWNWGLKNREKNQSGRLDSYRKIYEFLKCTMYLANHQSLPQRTMCFIPMLQEKEWGLSGCFKKKIFTFPMPKSCIPKGATSPNSIGMRFLYFHHENPLIQKGLKVSPSCARVESMTHVTCLGDCDQE
jgi:hypothetical protein